MEDLNLKYNEKEKEAEKVNKELHKEGNKENKISLDDSIKINVNYYAKDKLIGEAIFEPKNTFMDIREYYNNNLQSIIYKLKNKYLLNGKEIQDSDILEDLIEPEKENKLKEADIWVELDEIEEINDISEPSMEKILKPKSDPFGIYIYYPSEGKLTLNEYPEKISKRYDLIKFNKNYTYCNSFTDLFISGSENFNKAFNDFWVIEHDQNRIIKKKMPFDKMNHSMIYLFIENIVFIAGGNNKSTLYYDIDKNVFITWGNTNKIHEQPALIKSDDFLYCLSSFKNEKDYFERTDLTAKKPKWEKIYPNFQNEAVKESFLKKKYFAVSKCTNGNITLCAGKGSNEQTIIYNPYENLLSLSPGKDEEFLLGDKNFYKVDNCQSVAIPDDFEKCQTILLFDKKSKGIKKIKFSDVNQFINSPQSLSVINKSNNENKPGFISIIYKIENKNMDKKVIKKSMGPYVNNLINQKESGSNLNCYHQNETK